MTYKDKLLTRLNSLLDVDNSGAMSIVPKEDSVYIRIPWALLHKDDNGKTVQVAHKECPRDVCMRCEVNLPTVSIVWGGDNEAWFCDDCLAEFEADGWGEINSRQVLKHLPGRHDQKTHTPHKYIGIGGDSDRLAQLANRDSELNRKAREDWDNLSHEERMALMDPEAVDLSMYNELSRYRKSYNKPHELSGKIDSNVAKKLGENAHARIDSLSDALNPVTERMIRNYVDIHLQGAIKQAIEEGSLDKLDAGRLDSLVQKNIDKLVFQEIEARRRQLGDHGIRHILGNLDMANSMLDDPDMTPTFGMDRLLLQQAIIDHDMGYTAGVVTKSIAATKYHPKYSEKYASAQGYEDIFGKRASELTHIVATHDSADMDWKGNPVQSAVRASDNLSLFHEEKLPALFHDVPGATNELYKLQLARVGGEDANVLPEVRRNLRKLVNASDIDPRQKSELMAAVDEVSPYTPKFTLGMEAGAIDKFDYADGVMNVYLEHRPEREMLNGVFDLGDAQFNKFLENYNQEGSPSSGLALREKDSGEYVFNIKYTEAGSLPAGDIGNLYSVSVRPVISRIDRQLGSTATSAERTSLWPSVKAQLGDLLTESELAKFEKQYKAGTLDEFPLTAKEREFMKFPTTLKELLKNFQGMAKGIVKHLPGRHDQKTHTPHKYAGGSTPVTMEWLDKSKLFDFYDELEGSEVENMIKMALVYYGITQEELEGLEGFESDCPAGYKFNYRGYFDWANDDVDEDILGIYDPKGKRIYIPPIVGYIEDGPKIVLHELGHHVTISHPDIESKMNLAERMREAMRDSIDSHDTRYIQIEYGISEYAYFGGPGELLADTYMVYKAGSDKQRDNLDNLAYGIGIEGGLEGVLKEFVLVSTYELQARKFDGTIAIVAVPVKVDSRIVGSMPWKYTMEPAAVVKHLPGRHDQQTHTPYAYAKSYSFSKSSDKVWQGEQHLRKGKISKLKTGEIGEAVAMHALQEQLGANFSTLNEGINNSPIDIAGDSVVVEVKTGLASNGKSAQHWRATIRQPGKAEQELIDKMTSAQKRQHNLRKQQAILERKRELARQMSEEAGRELKPMTVGVILSPDGTKADVYIVDGFHSRLGWNNYATDEYYVGTYNVIAN